MDALIKVSEGGFTQQWGALRDFMVFYIKYVCTINKNL